MHPYLTKYASCRRVLQIRMPPVHVPASESLVVPDATLDYIGDVYLANPLLKLSGITFEMFLSRALRKIEAGSDRAFAYPFIGPLLLPKQRAVQRNTSTRRTA